MDRYLVGYLNEEIGKLKYSFIEVYAGSASLAYLLAHEVLEHRLEKFTILGIEPAPVIA